MPTARKLIDAEALFVDYLADDTGLDALGAGVSTELPRGFPKDGAPRVQVFRASGTSTDPATGYLERTILQVNAYGSSKAQAWDVFAETYRALLDAPGAHDAGVVTAVERITGPSWSPDPTTNAPRYVGSFAATVHPT